MSSAIVWPAVAACGGDDATPPLSLPDTAPAVDSISITPSERNIGIIGTSVPVRADALASNDSVLYGSTRDPDRFTWSSSAPDIATVDEDFTAQPSGATIRLLRGVGEGTAMITVTSQGVSDSMSVTVQDRARLAWSVPISGDIGGNAIGPDGTIYVATNDLAEETTTWYAIAPGGSIMWTAVLPYTERKIPAIGDDGTLYLGSWSWVRDRPYYSYEGRLIAVDPSGSVRWTLEGIEGIRSSPALGSDGTIYAAGGRHVYAVSPLGEIKWIYEREDNVFLFSSPAVASDGTVYVGAEDHFLYALNPVGSLRWRFETGDRVGSSPSIGADGTIYFGSDDGHLYAVRPDGTERWRVYLDARGVYGAPSVGPDGSAYIVADGITAINPNGTIRWTYPATARGATPILGGDGTVYAADRRVYAFDADGELLWDYQGEDLGGGSPIIAFDGTVIAVTEHALVGIVENRSMNGGYAGAAWPQIRGGFSASGRAGG